MTVRQQVYALLLTTAESLCAVESYLIDHPDLDPEDELFDEVDTAIRALMPTLQRLSAEPELTPTVQAFLTKL